MSVLFTGTNQGSFVSDGSAKILQIRQDLDWLWVYNESVQYAAGANTGAQFYWRRGMAPGRGTIYVKTSATNALQVGQIAANAGFYLIDSSINALGPSTAISGITAANPPVVLTNNTSLINNGDIVRIYNTVGARQLQAIDFTIGNISANTSYELSFMAPIAVANPGAGSWRLVPYDPIFYPRNRTISKIIVATSGTAGAGNPPVQADQAIVTLTVTHDFVVGQSIRFIIPTVNAAAFGMTELNEVEATIIAIGDQDADGVTNTIRVNVDVSGMTAFAWPLSAAFGFTPPQVVPVGENTAQALASGVSVLGDATINQGFIGIKLMAGANSPAGVAGNIISWVAGKSFSISN